MIGEYQEQQNSQYSSAMTPISVALVLVFMRMMFVLVVNGSNAAILGVFMNTVGEDIVCGEDGEEKMSYMPF